jgi:hypothetical protein
VRLLLAILFGVSLAVAAVKQALIGDGLALGVVIGVGGPLGIFAFLAAVGYATEDRPAPRKADPAKIARMERELGIEPEPPDLARTHAATMAEWDAVTAEAPTTPFEHPTPPSAHQSLGIRDASATFHGAPTWGHKIKRP